MPIDFIDCTIGKLGVFTKRELCDFKCNKLQRVVKQLLKQIFLIFVVLKALES